MAAVHIEHLSSDPHFLGCALLSKRAHASRPQVRRYSGGGLTATKVQEELLHSIAIVSFLFRLLIAVSEDVFPFNVLILAFDLFHGLGVQPELRVRLLFLCSIHRFRSVATC